MARAKNLSLAILSLSIFLLLVPEATAIATSSVDFLLTLLRSRGHTLFANAISTSDLLFDILRLRTLSLLAPPNPSLYTLDLTQTPPIYLSSLRLHVVPYLLSLSLPTNATPPPALIRTLLPSRELHLTTSPDGASLLVNGVELLLPPLYYSTSLAVYRLRRSLSFPDLYRSVPYPRNSRAMPFNRSTALPLLERRNHTVFPPINRTISPLVPENRTIFPPINWTISPLVPENRTVFPPINWTLSPLLPWNRTVFSLINWTHSPLVQPNGTVPAPAPQIDVTVTLLNSTVFSLPPVAENLSVASPPTLAADFGIFAPAPTVSPAPEIVSDGDISPDLQSDGLKCGPSDANDEQCSLSGDVAKAKDCHIVFLQPSLDQRDVDLCY